MYLTVKFYNLSIVPDGSVYIGDGDFDFQADRMPVNVKEKLAEYTDDLKKVHKKVGYTKKVMAEKRNCNLVY